MHGQNPSVTPDVLLDIGRILYSKEKNIREISWFFMIICSLQNFLAACNVFTRSITLAVASTSKINLVCECWGYFEAHYLFMHC